MPKNCDPPVKEWAARIVLGQRPQRGSLSQACAVVGASLGVGKETLWTRVRQIQIDAGKRKDLTTAEGEEIKHLKARNRRSREDGATLKAATSFIVRGLHPNEH